MNWVIVNLLVLVANLGVLAITVKLYTEILKDQKFDVREKRSGPSLPGTPGYGRGAGQPEDPHG